jgi:ADP-ribosylglycohydrolase
MLSEYDKNRILGCILGLAVGDALGMPAQSLTPEDIEEEFGSITDYFPSVHRGLGAGQFTQDTMQTTCFLLSLIDMGRFDLDDISRKLILWFEEKQIRGMSNDLEKIIIKLNEGADPKSSGLKGDSAKTSDVLLRGLLVGLFNAKRPDRIPEDSRLVTRITHNDLEAVRCTLTVAFITSAIFNNAQPDWILPQTLEYMNEGHVRNYLELTEQLLLNENQNNHLVYGYDDDYGPVLGRALYSFLATPEDFSSTVLSAISGGGQTSTAGALAGAFSGLYNGLGAIPEKWINELEQNVGLRDLALEFCEILG